MIFNLLLFLLSISSSIKSTVEFAKDYNNSLKELSRNLNIEYEKSFIEYANKINNKEYSKVVKVSIRTKNPYKYGTREYIDHDLKSIGIKNTKDYMLIGETEHFVWYITKQEFKDEFNNSPLALKESIGLDDFILDDDFVEKFSGTKNNYYDVFDGCTDVDSVCQKLDMNFFEGNILKALIGINRARHTGDTRHTGTSIERDINKIIHYANKLKGD